MVRKYEPRIEVYKAKSDWRFRVVAANGQKIAASEGYQTKRNAKVGARGLVDALRKRTLCIEI